MHDLKQVKGMTSSRSSDSRHWPCYWCGCPLYDGYIAEDDDTGRVFHLAKCADSYAVRRDAAEDPRQIEPGEPAERLWWKFESIVRRPDVPRFVGIPDKG